jgi:hypothetical protein
MYHPGSHCKEVVLFFFPWKIKWYSQILFEMLQGIITSSHYNRLLMAIITSAESTD